MQSVIRSELLPLKIALVQTSTHWHDAVRNRELFNGLIDKVESGTDLIVLPEMFSTGFTMASAEVAETMQGETVAWMRQQAQRRRCVICGSLVIQDDGEIFNRLVWMEPTGNFKTYDKRHRFRMAREHQHYASGSRRLIVELFGWRLCPMICYDLRFPVWLRNAGDYDVQLFVANWPAARRSAWQTLLKARAIENQAYVCGVNIVGQDGNGVVYSGGTAAISPDGEVLAEMLDKSAVVTVTLDPEPLTTLRASFPVWQDADEFIISG